MTQPPPTVLVVEDDLALRATIVESLEASGFAAAQASDAADAIERLQGFAYDGLVVDLKPVSYTHLTLPTILRV